MRKTYKGAHQIKNMEKTKVNLTGEYTKVYQSISRYSLFIFLIFILLSFNFSFVSAVPQVIFSEVNISIVNGSYTLKGEGLSATDTFPINGNCSFDYKRDRIPITFSRDLEGNNTDVAILINALNKNINATVMLEKCSRERNEIQTNYTICMLDVGYKGNFTECKDALSGCRNQLDSVNGDTVDKQKELDELKQQRNISLGIALVAIAGAVYMYRKNNVQTKRNPFEDLPSNTRM